MILTSIDKLALSIPQVLAVCTPQVACCWQEEPYIAFLFHFPSLVNELLRGSPFLSYDFFFIDSTSVHHIYTVYYLACTLQQKLISLVVATQQKIRNFICGVKEKKNTMSSCILGVVYEGREKAVSEDQFRRSV